MLIMSRMFYYYQHVIYFNIEVWGEEYMSRVARILNRYRESSHHDLESGLWGNMERKKQA